MNGQICNVKALVLVQVDLRYEVDNRKLNSKYS